MGKKIGYLRNKPRFVGNKFISPLNKCNGTIIPQNSFAHQNEKHAAKQSISGVLMDFDGNRQNTSLGQKVTNSEGSKNLKK